MHFFVCWNITRRVHNGDGIVDNDLDGDGLVDSSEGNSNISIAGSAPALLIGSDTRAVTLGAVGPGSLNYGLILSGAISATGTYDDLDSTGVKIGGSAGFATVLTGGLYVNVRGRVPGSKYPRKKKED